MKMNWADRVKELRMKLDLTQEEFAPLLRITLRQVVRIEKGETLRPNKATRDNIERLERKVRR